MSGSDRNRICRQLKSRILAICKDTEDCSHLEVDGIICLTLDKTTEYVVKIHEIFSNSSNPYSVSDVDSSNRSTIQHRSTTPTPGPVLPGNTQGVKRPRPDDYELQHHSTTPIPGRVLPFNTQAEERPRAGDYEIQPRSTTPTPGPVLPGNTGAEKRTKEEDEMDKQTKTNSPASASGRIKSDGLEKMFTPNTGMHFKNIFPFRCRFCSGSTMFETFDKFDQHAIINHTAHCCSYCSRGFRSKSGLKRHVVETHVRTNVQEKTHSINVSMSSNIQSI